MLDYNSVKCSLMLIKPFATTYCKTIKLFANIRQQLKCSPKLNVYSYEMFSSIILHYKNKCWMVADDVGWRIASDELLVRRWMVATWSRLTCSRLRLVRLFRWRFVARLRGVILSRRQRLKWSRSSTLLSELISLLKKIPSIYLSLIHIWRCRRSYACRSRWSPYH